MAMDGQAMRGPASPPAMEGLRPLNLGGLIDAAIKIYRSRWKTLIISVAIVTVPVLIITALVQVSAGNANDTVRTDSSTGTVHVDGSRLRVFFAATILVALLAIIANALASAAAFRSVSGAYLGDDPDWRTTLRFARARLRSVLWIVTLTTLLALLGVLTCFVGSVYAFGMFAVAVPVLLVEDVTGRKALGRSRQLVRGRFWTTVALLVLSALMTTFVQAALAVPALALRFTHTSYALTVFVQAIGNVIGTVLVTPFAAAVTMALYVDLRVRKEGFDLMLLAQRLGTAPPPGGFPAQPGPAPVASVWGPQPGWPGPGWPPPEQGWGPPPSTPGWPPGPPTWGPGPGAAPPAGLGEPDER